ncbi:hypothetical protein G9A89_010249 [Geosiphon pyriformis]|nr:hypothetical protein G9A89_010249 [Geosiphon pyriformis]
MTKHNSFSYYKKANENNSNISMLQYPSPVYEIWALNMKKHNSDSTTLSEVSEQRLTGEELKRILPTPNLGSPIRSSFANRVFDQVEQQVHGQLVESWPVTNVTDQKNLSSQGIAYGLPRSAEETGKGLLSKNYNGISISKSLTKNIKVSTELQVPTYPRLKEKNIYRISCQTISTMSSIPQDFDKYCEVGPSEWFASKTLMTVVPSGRNHVDFPKYESKEMTRWEIHSINELREVEVEFCTLFNRIITEKGHNFKKFRREFVQIQTKLMINNGYMLREFNLCTDRELKAFSAAFGWCVKTADALETLRQNSYKFPITFLLGVAMELQQKFAKIISSSN